jgi:aspartyl-tRNA(Asn)/glutamyl-tRNA(Gln) amidotransferase subunit A
MIKEIRTAYQDGSLSPLGYTQECLKKIQTVDSQFNAVVYLDVDGALRAAGESSLRWAEGCSLGPLDGIPVLIKDNLWVEGMPATWGSKLWAGFMPPKDDIAVARLRQAGAVILGKTNTPELAMSFNTDNLLFGVTRNPVNPRLTPGGSSGGSAAAVAAGFAPVALATDAGGSTRLPASLTGIYGLRATNGAVARRWGFPALALDFQVVGLMAAYLDDLVELFNVTSGPHPDDPLSAFVPYHAAIKGPLRIGWFGEVDDVGADKATFSAVEKTVELLKGKGHAIAEIDAPYNLRKIRHIWRTLSSYGSALAVAQRNPNGNGELSAPVRELVENGHNITTDSYLETIFELEIFCEDVSSSWGHNDIIVCPVTPEPAWPAELLAPDIGKDKSYAHNAPSVFTTWVNAIGYPALSVPVAIDVDNRPIGAQLVARPGNEESLFRLAREILPGR